MSSKNIFIHIPKTGGTTINCVMNKSQWQTKPDFNYRHIIYETKKSNSQDIFNPINYNKYDNYHIFMLLRNPIDRLISEYYFIKDRPEFMSLIKPIPRNLNEYIKNKQTQNYMIGFLLGKRMYNEDLVTEDDFDLVINTIENLNINVGIFEDYPKSLAYFSSITGIKWPKNIDIKRITLNRPKLDDISDEIKQLIIKNNALDFKLYEYCLNKFESKTKLLSSKNSIRFKGDKYNYVLKYTERFNLLEIGLKDKNFIKKHQLFFEDLNLHLQKKLNIKDGKLYVKLWNDCFISTMNSTYPNTQLSNKLNSVQATDPLDRTKQICDVLNIITRGKLNTLYKKNLAFNPELIQEKDITQSGFLSKLKSKLFS